MRSPDPVVVPRAPFHPLLAKELWEVASGRALWTMLLIMCPIVGFSFFQAVSLYGEASASASDQAALASGLSPLDGVLVPTFGAFYVTVTLLHGGRQLDLANVLLDTGSAGTLFAADQVLAVGLQYEADDPVQRIRGIGGAEFVFVKRVNRLSVGELQVNDFAIEVGAMDYGFAIDGIIGTDVLLQVGAIIDLSRLEIHRASP